MSQDYEYQLICRCCGHSESVRDIISNKNNDINTIEKAVIAHQQGKFSCKVCKKKDIALKQESSTISPRPNSQNHIPTESFQRRKSKPKTRVVVVKESPPQGLSEREKRLKEKYTTKITRRTDKGIAD